MEKPFAEDDVKATWY